MRRQKRDLSVWHVFCRGARRLNLFHEEADFAKFLLIVREALAVSGCGLWAYVLMSNHFHFVVQADSGQLTRLMRRVDYLYSSYHNAKYSLSGHAFDGPYKAYAQGKLIPILYKIAYVFLNPVTAGMVVDAGDYRWSGYRSFLGLGGSPLPVEAGWVLSRISVDPAEARRRFLEILGRERRLLKRRGQGSLGRGEVLLTQFESLYDYAVHLGGVSGLSPAEVAVYWGNLAGVPSRVMARVLNEVDVKKVSNLAFRLKTRAAADPALRQALELP